jgi:hypothetical protein
MDLAQTVVYADCAKGISDLQSASLMPCFIYVPRGLRTFRHPLFFDILAAHTLVDRFLPHFFGLTYAYSSGHLRHLFYNGLFSVSAVSRCAPH